MNVNDGWRDAKLPVRVKVRGVPDVPYFTTSFSSLPVAKEGAQFNFEISTADPDNSPRTIKVFGLPSEGESWLKLVDMNSTSGTARLSGVPPSQSSGKNMILHLLYRMKRVFSPLPMVSWWSMVKIQGR